MLEWRLSLYSAHERARVFSRSRSLEHILSLSISCNLSLSVARSLSEREERERRERETERETESSSSREPGRRGGIRLIEPCSSALCTARSLDTARSLESAPPTTFRPTPDFRGHEHLGDDLVQDAHCRMPPPASAYSSAYSSSRSNPTDPAHSRGGAGAYKRVSERTWQVARALASASMPGLTRGPDSSLERGLG